MKESIARPDETLDDFHRGRVRLLQPKTGYRFSTDAPLLAGFAEIRPGEDVCELGTGNGVVAILLGNRPFRKLVAVEIQPRLSRLARRNAALNGLEERVEVVEADLRTWRPGIRFDVVLSNPPYHDRRSAVPPPDPEKAIAKHEISCDILEIMRAAFDLLKPDGRAYFVFPVRRESAFRNAVSSAGLHLRTVRRIVPRTGEPAGHFLSEAVFASVHSGPALEIPPLVLHDGPGGGFSPEARAILEGSPDEARL